MKILAVTDFHGKDSSKENLRNLISDDYDLLLILGDITQFGPAREVNEVLDLVEKKDFRSLVIPGNCDPEESIEVLEQRGVNLHSRSIYFGGVTFVGLGGSNETPFDTPFELSESEIKERLNDLALEVGGDWFLVTHAPPFETKADMASGNVHAGSKGVREIVEEKQPLVNVCGHIHEARGLDKIGDTKVINPGPIIEGYAAEFVYKDGVKVNLIEI